MADLGPAWIGLVGVLAGSGVTGGIGLAALRSTERVATRRLRHERAETWRGAAATAYADARALVGSIRMNIIGEELDQAEADRMRTEVDACRKELHRLSALGTAAIDAAAAEVSDLLDVLVRYWTINAKLSAALARAERKKPPDTLTIERINRQVERTEGEFNDARGMLLGGSGAEGAMDRLRRAVRAGGE